MLLLRVGLSAAGCAVGLAIGLVAHALWHKPKARLSAEGFYDDWLYEIRYPWESADLPSEVDQTGDGGKQEVFRPPHTHSALVASLASAQPISMAEATKRIADWSAPPCRHGTFPTSNRR